MVTYNIRPPKPGMTYQVWLVTADAKISAGTFKPDAAGRTMMHARYALDRDALRSVAVTEEPEGGMPAPTGPMVIAGTA
jgi:anti-sigma-K factor RskA